MTMRVVVKTFAARPEDRANGPVETWIDTFDIEDACLEKFLRSTHSRYGREIIGIEVLAKAKEGGE